MKYIRYAVDNHISYGRLENDGTVRQLSHSPLENGESMETVHPMETVRLLSPLAAPRVFGVGLNYLSHAREAGKPTPPIPMLFMKPGTTVIGPGEPIVYPLQGTEVHFEAELAVVIGRQARRVSEADALKFVFGYTCANDVSERVIQFAEMERGCLLIGKSFDSFCPLGPVIATGLDPANLEVISRVNGKERQHACTADLIFSVAHLIAYISDAITLLPGDVILTGTPAGVGPVQPGDVVEIEVPQIGTLSNPVVAEE